MAFAYQPALDGVRAVAVAHGPAVPPRLARRRLPRGVGLLHAVGLPDHVARPRRARPHGPPRRRRVLRSPPAPPAAGQPGLPRRHRRARRRRAVRRRRATCGATSGAPWPRSTTGSPCRAGRRTPTSSPPATASCRPSSTTGRWRSRSSSTGSGRSSSSASCAPAGRRRVLVVAALTAAAAVAAPLIAGVWGPDAAYWATPARLGEILVGALVAVVLARSPARRRLPPAPAWAGRRRARRGRVGRGHVAERIRPGVRGLAARVRRWPRRP